MLWQLRVLSAVIVGTLLWAKPVMGAADFTAAHNVFALELYARLGQSQGNLVVSPFSVRTALAMSWAGARGATAEQMAEVLRFPHDTSAVHLEYRSHLGALDSSTVSGCDIRVANGLFAQTGYPIRESYQELLRGHYHASLHEVDLTGWPNEFDPGRAASARKSINAWVAEQTGSRIDTLLPPSLPDADSRLLLVNAMSFRGRWETPFDRAKTTDQPFQLGSGGSGGVVTVPTMVLFSHLRYMETATLQMLELPYVSNRFSMLILLPRGNRRLSDIEMALGPTTIDQFRQRSRLEEVAVALPRFKTKSALNLEPPLRSMGMTNAFVAGGADFSGISEGEPLFIRAVLHSAYVETDEEGTEAAAATAVDIAVGVPKRFVVDRPFLFLIRSHQTGLILFVGRVVDPLKV